MAALDRRVHRALAEDSRVRLLRLLAVADRPVSAQELADQVNLHLTTVRAHLDVLLDAGLVDSEPEQRSTPGRPRILYRATAELPQERGGYRLLAEVLASHLAGTTPDPAQQAVAAGRAWGEYLVDRPPPFVRLSAAEARRQVVDLFQELGFDPEVAAEGGQILLHRCPFLDVARRHQNVVCSVHLGLLQGALEALGAPLTSGQLEPFVEPSLCVSHLTPMSA
jgi:predicted ArsR family transcriptional regulator